MCLKDYGFLLLTNIPKSDIMKGCNMTKSGPKLKQAKLDQQSFKRVKNLSKMKTPTSIICTLTGLPRDTVIRIKTGQITAP